MNNKNIYEIDNIKDIDFLKKYIYSNEYSLKKNNFNPSKDSPNFFMTKLEFRMKSYYLEEQLNNDPFSLDTK
jgi:hypothetical protein